MSRIICAGSVNWLGVLAALPLALLGCGAADTLVTGFGNNHNIIGSDVIDRVASELARAKVTPPVSDDDLRAVFAAIRERALKGDPEAALVLLRVAAHQRDPGERE